MAKDKLQTIDTGKTFKSSGCPAYFILLPYGIKGSIYLETSFACATVLLDQACKIAFLEWPPSQYKLLVMLSVGVDSGAVLTSKTHQVILYCHHQLEGDHVTLGGVPLGVWMESFAFYEGATLSHGHW